MTLLDDYPYPLCDHGARIGECSRPGCLYSGEDDHVSPNAMTKGQVHDSLETVPEFTLCALGDTARNARPGNHRLRLARTIAAVARETEPMGRRRSARVVSGIVCALAVLVVILASTRPDHHAAIPAEHIRRGVPLPQAPTDAEGHIVPGALALNHGSFSPETEQPC
jgi:hypothetical protein